jgi:hypothetical protein
VAALHCGSREQRSSVVICLHPAAPSQRTHWTKVTAHSVGNTRVWQLQRHCFVHSHLLLCLLSASGIHVFVLFRFRRVALLRPLSSGRFRSLVLPVSQRTIHFTREMSPERRTPHLLTFRIGIPNTTGQLGQGTSLSLCLSLSLSLPLWSARTEIE